MYMSYLFTKKNHLYVIIIKYNNEHKYKMGGAEYENY